MQDTPSPHNSVLLLIKAHIWTPWSYKAHTSVCRSMITLCYKNCRKEQSCNKADILKEAGKVVEVFSRSQEVGFVGKAEIGGRRKGRQIQMAASTMWSRCVTTGFGWRMSWQCRGDMRLVRSTLEKSAGRTFTLPKFQYFWEPISSKTSRWLSH